jgi:hypothetical protein
MDNWIAATQGSRLRAAAEPLVVDLGYGSDPVTAVELLSRLRTARPDVTVLGLEIDAERVANAKSAERPGLRFAVGGFELAGRHPTVVRAANVLRQYPESAVAEAWAAMRAQLPPGGVIVDGTCDELGRLATWALIDGDGPVSLTLSVKLELLHRPSELAPRLVKALIHRNVDGEPVHEFLRAMDDAWDRQAPLAPFGNRQRWQAMAATLRQSWPVLDGPGRHRFGEVTVAWAAVAPSVSGL